MQDFTIPNQAWGTGYKMDQASTMWIRDYADGTTTIYAGDLATKDPMLSNVSPEVTAFVKDYTITPSNDSKIHVAVFEGNDDTPEINTSVYAPPQGVLYLSCRYPSVEVTYDHPDGEDHGNSKFISFGSNGWELPAHGIYITLV